MKYLSIEHTAIKSAKTKQVTTTSRVSEKIIDKKKPDDSYEYQGLKAASIYADVAGSITTEASGLSLNSFSVHNLLRVGIKQKTPTILANVGVVKAASTYADVAGSIPTKASGLSHLSI
jgi:hypothetical protein